MIDFEEVKISARERYIPVVRDKTCAKLMAVCKQEQPSSILEIGTAIGYSGGKMLVSCNANLVTIEKDHVRAEEAENNFKKWGLENRVTLILDDALLVLENLCQKNQKFDLIFLDGAKGQYIHYFPLLKRLLSKNGTIFVDNVLLNGLILDESKVTHKNRSMFNNMKKFISFVKNDSTLSSEFFDIEDGFCIIKNV